MMVLYIAVRPHSSFMVDIDGTHLDDFAIPGVYVKLFNFRLVS